MPGQGALISSQTQGGDEGLYGEIGGQNAFVQRLQGGIARPTVVSIVQ
jgi:hypothetical protein